MGPRLNLSRRDLTVLALGILMTSLGVLMFEITLTRLFSAVLAYHYVFIVVSVAILGLGVGAIFFRLIHRKIHIERSFSVLCKLSLIFALSIPIVTTFLLKIPYTDLLAIYYVISFIPFFLAGMIFALVFDRFTEHSGKLYCASMLGSGIGSFGVIFFLDFFGANTVLLVGVISSMGTLAFATCSKRKTLIASSLASLLFLSFIFAAGLAGSYIEEMSGSPYKVLFSVLKDPELKARIARTYWSAYSRTDLVELGSQDMKLIFNDGGAGMEMFRFDGENFDNLAHLRGTSAFFPFYFGGNENVLIIGPGGGKDVLIALMGGAKNIIAVEVNPDIVKIVREESDFNGSIYYRKGVRWVVDEGRSFVKRSNEKYGVIMLVLVYTDAAREVVGYSLTESYIFTVEAFGDYFDHLADDGKLLVVAHDDAEVIKLFTTAMSMLTARGKSVQEAARHVAIITEAGHHPRPAFILRKLPFSENESSGMHAAALELGFQPAYFPYVHEAQAFAPLLSGQKSLGEWISMIPFNASPATDDSPFFYNNEKGLPSALSTLFYGVLFLTTVFFITAWLSLEHSLKREQKIDCSEIASRKLGSFSILFYFLLLGVAFMLIEVVLVQKFILFLGQPTLAFSVVLVSLLLSSSTGSFFSDRFKEESVIRRLTSVLFFVGFLLTIFAMALPFVFKKFLSQSAAVRSLISAGLLYPLGFLMGMPFPIGLKISKQIFKRDVGWMWGINGAASVLGSVLAVVIAVSSGFTLALVFGAAAYPLAGLILAQPFQKRIENTLKQVHEAKRV